jgi:hypothetical protein
MKDKDNVLRAIDEAENILAIIVELAQKQAIDTTEAVNRINEVRRKLYFINERVTIS